MARFNVNVLQVSRQSFFCCGIKWILQQTIWLFIEQKNCSRGALWLYIQLIPNLLYFSNETGQLKTQLHSARLQKAEAEDASYRNQEAASK